MDKRYQVFLSSTYSDLKDERQAVMQALMEMDCIPAGMELFPAADEEQWTFIQRVIDDSDYYVLVLGGRYGSLSPEGISYTEQEFDYALSKGIKVVALVHGDVTTLPFAKVDASPDTQAKLTAFREKVTTGRLVKFWKDASELPGLVALSLQRTIKMYPAQGWVRANDLASIEVLQEGARLQRRVTELEKELAARELPAFSEALASGADEIEIRLKWTEYSSRSRSRVPHQQTETVSWDEIFDLLGSRVMHSKTEDSARVDFSHALAARRGISSSARVGEDQFFTIAQHLSALGLISHRASRTTEGGQATFIAITPAGQNYLSKLRVVAKKGN